MVFSSNDDILLVTFVEKNPFLYDRKHKYYGRPAVKNAVWEKIGEKLGKTGAECKSRWSSLRICYKQSRRITESGTPDLPLNGPNEIRIWPHEKLMCFLDKPAKKFPIITVIAEGDSNARSSFPSVAEQASEVEPTTSRRSRGEEDDDVNLFLKSVAKNLKQLPPDKVAQIQAKTFSLLAEMVSNALINQPVPGSSDAKFPIITAIAEGDSNARSSFPSVAEQASEVEPTTSRRSRGEEYDDVNLFLKSVAKKIKQLPPDMVAQIQAKTFSLLAEMVSNALINQPVPGSSGAKFPIITAIAEGDSNARSSFPSVAEQASEVEPTTSRRSRGEEYDDVNLFLKSAAKKIKQLPPDMVAQIQAKTFSLLAEMVSNALINQPVPGSSGAKFPIITAIAEGDSNARSSFPSVAEQASEVEPTTSRRSRGEEYDDVNLFLKSVAKKIKQLPPDMVAQIQAKTFSLLAEMVSNALINQPVPGSSGAK